MRDVQSFLGFINFYAEFIPNSTHLTAPLYNLTVGKKGTDSDAKRRRARRFLKPQIRALLRPSAGEFRPLETIRCAH